MRIGGRDAALVRSCGNLRLPRGRPPETLGNMGFAVAGTVAPPPLEALVDALGEALERAGSEQSAADDSPDLVLNVIAAERPRPFRRRSRGTFVAALHELDEPPPDPLREGYPLLVRALANVSLTYVPHQGVWFTTLERGSYLVADDDGIDALAERDRQRVPSRSRARAVARRRGHGVDRGGGTRARQARPPAFAVPRRGARRRARPPAHQTSLRPRRPLLREPLGAEPDPAHAVIGLRNHGITATGSNLEEILGRVTPRLVRQVPMT